jgi:RNA polymerase sigma-70 factor (ECF subfamily)
MKPSQTHSQHTALEGSALQLQEFVRELTANQGRIRAFVVSLMPGSPDVGDVVQETNLTLWKSRERYEPGSNFIAWAFAIARLEVLHQRDRAKRLGRIVLSNELTHVLAQEIPDHFTQEKYLHILESCMAKLSDTQREIIEARYQPGQSLEIHARLSGRKPSALRVALLRIRSSLRECIEKSVEVPFA